MDGIYCYIDSHTDKIVYIGKDSNIGKKRRHKAHHWKSKYNDQPINQILQNNPDRYIYDELCNGNFTDDELNMLEKGYIKTYTPKFNFTDGGDGVPKGTKPPITGKHHSEESKQKIREGKLKSTYNNTTGFLRVSKVKRDCLKQGFEWRYSYKDDDGKLKIINSIDLNKVKEKVLARGLEWRELDD